jgi:FKBP-type peptidyl-prolyl cis-trans isomerase FkpA
MKKIGGLGLGFLMAVAALTVLSWAAPAQAQSPESPTDPKNAATLYALGVLMSRNLGDLQLSDVEFDRLKAGLTDGFNHRAQQVDLTKDTPKIQASVQALRRVRVARLIRQREEDGQAYLAKAAATPGALRTADGMVMISTHPGTGGSPGKNDQVTVNYEGRLIDGTVFDGSKQSGEPATFSLVSVIPCWAEALPLMKVGGRSRIVCPPDLAYGALGAPPKIGSQLTLEFDVELLAIAPARAVVSTDPRAQ